MKNTLFSLLIMVGLVGVSNANAGAESIEKGLKCAKVIKTDSAFSSNGRALADQVFICINKKGTEAALHYRAIAMVNFSFTGLNQSPWIGINVTDKNGKSLFKKDKFQMADVPRCGGRTGHWKRIPVGNSVHKIFDFEISLSAAKPRKCTPMEKDRFIYNVTDNPGRYNKAIYTSEEKAIMSIAARGGF